MGVLWIRCPVFGLDELVPDRHIRALTNHHTHVALTVTCFCGDVHVYRTGRRWKSDRPAGAEDRPKQGSSTGPCPLG